MISLGYNHIGIEGTLAISQTLLINQSLKKLNLGKIIQNKINSLFLEHNNIGIEGQLAISEAMKINQVLLNLNLGKISAIRIIYYL